MSTEAKPEYSPGLAGVIAGETKICWVDPNAGLMYRGYDIHEMGDKATFEEVAYLLLNGELPNGKQLNEFKEQIAAQRDGGEIVQIDLSAAGSVVDGNEVGAAGAADHRDQLHLRAGEVDRGRPQALQRAVEERYVGNTRGGRQRRRVDGEAVVLAGDQDLTRILVEHRMVGAMVAEFHLERLPAHRQA